MKATVRRAVGVVLVAVAVSAAACSDAPVLIRHAEARRLASRLHAQFSTANEAGNRAVMADTDEYSKAAAEEAQKAAKAAAETLDELQPIVESLGYKDEIETLIRFSQHFAEYRTLNDEILPLAVENTNLKAQRLAFGDAKEAADAFTAALTLAVPSARRAAAASALADAAKIAVLEIQVVQPRHIAEADNDAMTTMEAQMAAAETRARNAMTRLRAQLPASRADVDRASAALDRFFTLNREIVELSRKNTNVRSLALTLGRKRVVAATCEDQLRVLDEALAAHAFKGTR